jgi:hypothetical protein
MPEPSRTAHGVQTATGTEQDDPAFNDAGPWDQTLLQMR